MSIISKLVRATSCPSKITLAFASMKRCGNCGVVGHNRRTCSVPEHYAAICHPTTAPTGGTKKCGKCGVFGHNRRTCGADEPEVSAVKAVKSFTSPQLFARLPNYISQPKRVVNPVLGGLKGCSLFDKPVKTRDDLSEAERRVAKELATLLY